ncbi:putative CXXC motif containing zinc binding protein [Cocos nucifera]|uniref:Putative CXXC motif containing zinc binding protein n=1 Tax=Cocos nucifera TaxID=13894 RepID=A0A8K0I9U1_COCNU|nr:putative CXXC motif containing zinc binding protein [Cocos nucifera]
MVYYMLSFTAELENLTNLQPRGGCDDPNYPYYFKVKCENCGEVSQKETCATMSESVPLSSGKGTANLVQKCKLCGREGSIQMIPGHGQPLTRELSQRELNTRLMVFDCRGFEPVDFSFGDGWKAESVSIYCLSFTVCVAQPLLVLHSTRICFLACHLWTYLFSTFSSCRTMVANSYACELVLIAPYIAIHIDDSCTAFY